MRYVRKKELLHLTEETALGALIEYQQKHREMVTCAGDRFFRYMKEQNLYTTDKDKIAERVSKAGLTDVFCLC